MSALKLTDICVALDGTPVLDRVNLNLGTGEFVSLLGPSGAGKSTLFRLMTGDLVADRGTILLDGAPLDDGMTPFAFMPQRDALMPWRRVLDNLTLGLEVQGVSRTAARAKVLPLLGEFGLKGYAQHYPAQLSGGMRQRAALLRTVVQDRPVQLLDEPFGALDALTRVGMQRWLEARWRAARWTTLLITHDVREAVALSDRIYVLSRKPARVIAEFLLPHPRPRFQPDADADLVGLEAEILQTLLAQTGD